MVIQSQSWPHLEGLQLADPDFASSGNIDIILGADVYGKIIESDLRKGGDNSPIAQLTIFGWIVSGPIGASQSRNLKRSYHVSLNRELLDIMSLFWKTEEVPAAPGMLLSDDEQQCENHFISSHLRDKTGRYIVKLPFKDSPSQLGDSKIKALRVMNSLIKRFESDSSYRQAYFEFMKDYQSLDHMRPVQDSAPEPNQAYYLPHHGVMRDTNNLKKIRVVFNGSSNTTTGVSLNQLLHAGSKLQTDLIDVLLWFRQFQYVFTTDVEKMYRQIRIHPDHWDFQRIFWFDSNGDIVPFHLTTVTYGLTCAPFQALRAFVQLIKDHGEQFPLAVPALKKRRYVDDVFGGADSIQQAQVLIKQLTDLCMAGGTCPRVAFICP